MKPDIKLDVQNKKAGFKSEKNPKLNNSVKGTKVHRRSKVSSDSKDSKKNVFESKLEEEIERISMFDATPREMYRQR